MGLEQLIFREVHEPAGDWLMAETQAAVELRPSGLSRGEFLLWLATGPQSAEGPQRVERSHCLRARRQTLTPDTEGLQDPGGCAVRLAAGMTEEIRPRPIGSGP